MNARAEDVRWEWEPVGQRSRIRTLIITDDRGQRSRFAERCDTVVVGTPLELITELEGPRLFSTVILAGRFAADREFSGFLGDFYPELGVERLGGEAS